MKYIGFTPELFQKLITYLGTRPFNEVENLFVEVRNNIKALDVPDATEQQEQSKEGADDNVQSTETNTVEQAPIEPSGGQTSEDKEPELSN